VEICNLALGNIRAGSINSLDESSVQAQTCKLRYPLMRDMLLQTGTWQFARSIKPLALLTDEIFNWGYAYQYPSDCMKIHRLVGEQEEITLIDTSFTRSYREDLYVTPGELRVQIPYEILNIDGNKVIGSNDTDLRIDYAVEATDTNLFSPTFIIALSHLLAAEIAIPIVGSEAGRSLRNDSYTLYQQYLASAEAQDANEQYATQENSEYVNARR